MNFYEAWQAMLEGKRVRVKANYYTDSHAFLFIKWCLEEERDNEQFWGFKLKHHSTLRGDEFCESISNNELMDMMGSEWEIVE